MIAEWLNLGWKHSVLSNGLRIPSEGEVGKGRRERESRTCDRKRWGIEMCGKSWLPMLKGTAPDWLIDWWVQKTIFLSAELDLDTGVYLAIVLNFLSLYLLSCL